MPVSWQKDLSFHEKIRAAPQGDAIAALKLYIVLCLKANFNLTGTLDAGCVQLSLTSLSEIVDISRPMVVAGLKLLDEGKLLNLKRDVQGYCVLLIMMALHTGRNYRIVRYTEGRMKSALLALSRCPIDSEERCMPFSFISILLRFVTNTHRSQI